MTNPYVRKIIAEAETRTLQRGIVVVKADVNAVILRERLLKSVDYMESQAGRLFKVAADAQVLAESVTEIARQVRAQVKALTTS